jgi:sulfur transfer protein SufE
MLYLTIAEGDDPEKAVPILGTTDTDLIRGVAELLRRRLGQPEPAPILKVERRRLLERCHDTDEVTS